MNLTRISFFIFVSSLFVSCAESTLEVEVTNNTEGILEEVVVATSSGKSYVEFQNLKAGETQTQVLDMSEETGGDGSYSLNVVDLGTTESYGYYTNGSPMESKMKIEVGEEENKVDFIN